MPNIKILKYLVASDVKQFRLVKMYDTSISMICSGLLNHNVLVLNINEIAPNIMSFLIYCMYSFANTR